MIKGKRSNIPNLVLMIKPRHFSFNSETIDSNHFQKKLEYSNLEERVQDSFQSVIKVLKDHNIKITVFEDQETVVPDAVFSNNWISTDPMGRITIYPMKAKNRRLEIREDIIDWVKQAVHYEELIDLRKFNVENGYLEGTGSIVFDHFTKTAYACESSRTSIPLYETYCDRIGYSAISFESLDLFGRPIYHTNVMMAITENYCLINLESITNPIERNFCRISIEKSGKKVIPITYRQMAAFAGNVIEVLNNDKKSCLIMSSSAHKILTPTQLNTIETHSTLIIVDVNVFEEIGGGGIRCMLTGLYS